MVNAPPNSQQNLVNAIILNPKQLFGDRIFWQRLNIKGLYKIKCL